MHAQATWRSSCRCPRERCCPCTTTPCASRRLTWRIFPAITTPAMLVIIFVLYTHLAAFVLFCCRNSAGITAVYSDASITRHCALYVMIRAFLTYCIYDTVHLHTAGFIDEDGYVFVMSRTDDVLNVAGHRLSSGAMEEVRVVSCYDDSSYIIYCICLKLLSPMSAKA